MWVWNIHVVDYLAPATFSATRMRRCA